MKLKQFIELTKDMPEDTELIVTIDNQKRSVFSVLIRQEILCDKLYPDRKTLFNKIIIGGDLNDRK